MSTSTPFLPACLVLLARAATAQLPPPPVPPENPITEEKRILGKVLFWEEQLSSDNTISCGTCHIPVVGGSDPRLGPGSVNPGLDGVPGTPDDKRTSAGVRSVDPDGHYQPHATFGFDPQVTPRLAPSPFAAAWFDELFWDGRASSTFVDPETGLVSIPAGGALESQSVGPIVSSVEMAREGRTWNDVRTKLEGARPLALAWDLTPDLDAALSSGATYPDLFEEAFGDPDISAERIAYALATYQRTLVPDQTPWDRFIGGESNALTPAEKDGLTAFNSSQNRCTECHPAPLFSDGTFRNLGLRPIAEDPGRQAATGLFEDRGKFKVPSLRNVALRQRFFHNGDPGHNSMLQVVLFYGVGGGAFLDNRDPLMDGLNIPLPTASSIATFLTGGLTDPRVEAELPPFDRPRLNSERPQPNPSIEGGAVAGSGGIEPQVIAVTPPNIGNGDFALGLFDALGGARAIVNWSLVSSASGPGLPHHMSPRVHPSQFLVLNGAGPGDGHGTWRRPIPASSALAGAEFTMQWIVRDPGAPRGRAKSDVVRLTLF